jgi:hypothetical protein
LLSKKPISKKRPDPITKENQSLVIHYPDKTKTTEPEIVKSPVKTGFFFALYTRFPVQLPKMPFRGLETSV